MLPCMELGVATFADLSSGISPEQRMRNLMEEVQLADQLGLDVFAIGEHHREDFLISSPAIALAAAAVTTERIRLSSAVTVLSSDDPVRVFQDFAEVDLLSGGRAEIMAGRGSFIESFPLFGYDLKDYDELYAEKLDLLLRLRDDVHVTWAGRHRAPLDNAGVWPRPGAGAAAGVGGRRRLAAVDRARRHPGPAPGPRDHRRPARALRAARRPLPRGGARRPATTPSRRSVAINTHAFVGATSAQADAAFAAPYLAMMNRIGRERGWPPSGRAEYEALRSPRGAVAAGSPEQVAEKILFEHELFGHQRYIGQMSVGAVDHRDVLRSMELFGTEVAPLVRAEVARREDQARAAA